MPWMSGAFIVLPNTESSFLQNPRGAMVGKYKVDLPSFERLALPHLRDTGDAGLLVIDEVGK